MLVGRLNLLFNTVRYLRVKQVAWRVWYRIKKVKIPSATEIKPRLWLNSWSSPAWQLVDWDGCSEFEFLGYRGSIDSQNGWNDPSKPKLWLYNLHYLDVLNGQWTSDNKEALYQLVGKWIDENPPASGNGWEPYSISLRLVNLSKWCSSLQEYDESILASMGQQAAALVERLEYHILGNHLFANAKALVFVGTFFEGEASEVWLEKGLSILDREMPEQFLADGGHFELSPMYHAALLWDVCDLINLAGRSGIDKLESRVVCWKKILQRGLLWLENMIHPDGQISFFNDAAFGIAPTYQDLTCYAASFGVELSFIPVDRLTYTVLPDTGYVSVKWPAEHKAILDLAKVGPDYQPGHAHADTLSFELSLFGNRVFVNSGTSKYGDDAERLRQRGTSAHNTVEVDGEDSSEVWGGFRVARRAYPSAPVIGVNDDLKISCSHNGYRRLKGKVVHSRDWHFHDKKMMVVDRLEGDFSESKAYFYIHPDVKVSKEDGLNSYVLTLMSGKELTVRFDGKITTELKGSRWHSRFGGNIDNHCLLAKFSSDSITTTVEW